MVFLFRAPSGGRQLPACKQFSIMIRQRQTTMTNPKIPVTEDELHAYVDNELPAERRGDVEAMARNAP